jgi:hypothetical protein
MNFIERVFKIIRDINIPCSEKDADDIDVEELLEVLYNFNLRIICTKQDKALWSKPNYKYW